PLRLFDHIKPAVAGELIADHLDTGSMPPEALRALLDAYGVEMPPTTIVAAADAVATAAVIGYPVAVKAEHRRRGRTLQTGTTLDLHDPDAVADPVATMRAHLGEGAARVIVQRMTAGGLGLWIHSSLDERVGPIVTAGLGGAQADVIADESSRLAP